MKKTRIYTYEDGLNINSRFFANEHVQKTIIVSEKLKNQIKFYS